MRPRQSWLGSFVPCINSDQWDSNVYAQKRIYLHQHQSLSIRLTQYWILDPEMPQASLHTSLTSSTWHKKSARSRLIEGSGFPLCRPDSLQLQNVPYSWTVHALALSPALSLRCFRKSCQIAHQWPVSSSGQANVQSQLLNDSLNSQNRFWCWDRCCSETWAGVLGRQNHSWWLHCHQFQMWPSGTESLDIGDRRDIIVNVLLHN